MISPNHPAEPKLIIFDLAGTTVDDGYAVHDCLAAALREVVQLEVTRAECNGVMGIPKPIAIRTLLESRDRTDAMAAGDRILAAFEARMLQFYRSDEQVREFAGTTDLFRLLAARGIKVGLDTGFSTVITQTIVDRFGWVADQLVHAWVASDQVPQGRPAPDMVFRLMELTGVRHAASVAKVGDTPSDLYEGTNAGCGWVIGVTGGSHSEAELRPHPHTHLVHTVPDLPALLNLQQAAPVLAGE